MGARMSTAMCESDLKLASKRVMKPKDLPIYSQEASDDFVYVVPPPTKFESAIKDARLAVGPYTGTVADLAGEAVSQGTYAISSLQRPENELIRYATIGLGAMCGSLLAYRKSFIKKLTLPIFGALGMTALSYPDKFSAVKDIAKEELAEASAVGLIFAKSVYVDLVDRMFNSPSLLGSADSKNDDGVKEINRIGEQKKGPGSPSSLIAFLPPSPKIAANSIPKDYGQSNQQDQDLYTTRS